MYLRWPILEWVEIQSSYMYVGERAVRLIIMFLPSLYIKRSLIRVRTGKDPVVLLGMLSPRLYNLPDEFSIQEELSFGALLNPSKLECVCDCTIREISCLELVGTLLHGDYTYISSHFSERWLRPPLTNITFILNSGKFRPICYIRIIIQSTVY